MNEFARECESFFPKSQSIGYHTQSLSCRFFFRVCCCVAPQIPDAASAKLEGSYPHNFSISKLKIQQEAFSRSPNFLPSITSTIHRTLKSRLLSYPILFCQHRLPSQSLQVYWRVLTVTKRCPLTVKIIPIVIDSYFESTMNRKTTRSTLPSSVAQSRRRPSMCISSSWGVSVVIGSFLLLLLLSSPRSFCHAFTPSTRTILVPTYSSRPPSTHSLGLSNPSMPRIHSQQSPPFPSTPSHYFSTCLHASNNKNNYDEDEIGDWNLRLKCCFPYLLPLLDGNHFGYFLFQRIPLLGQIDDLLLGGTADFLANTGLGLLVFIAFTLGTRFQFDMDRNLRFNAQQAALIDIVLVLPEIVSESVDPGDVPQVWAEPCANFVYYALVTAVGYSVWRILWRNQKPSGIPYLSDYAETMVGPL